VTYSQTLGLVGYSLLPLVIVAPIVSLLKQYQWLAFFVKVRPQYCIAGLAILNFTVYCSIVRVLACYGRRTALALSWRRRSFNTRSLFFSTPSSYSLSISFPSTREHSTVHRAAHHLVTYSPPNLYYHAQNFYSWSDVCAKLM
jgi:hypothetical protein